MVQRWLHAPRRLWLRRATFQVHLWLGLALGLYVVVLSLTGSILVYRAELDRLLGSPHAALDARATPATVAALREAAQRLYPDWTITAVHEGHYVARGRRPPDPTALVVLERAGDSRSRLFNPYTGEDLGDNMTPGQFAVLWVARLHDDLLLDRPTGTQLNAVLSLVFTVLVLTGLIVWWPGMSRWYRGLGVQLSAGWRRVNWDLHSAIGLWMAPFLVMWGISGWYMGMPEPLTDLAEALSSPDQPYGDRPADLVLEWLPRLHFGRWRDPLWGPWLKSLWAAAGVMPALLAATGAVMWWNRVVRRRRAAQGAVVVEAA